MEITQNKCRLNTSSHMLLDHSEEKVFLEKGTPMTYFYPAPGRIWPQHLNTCVGHDIFITTEFRKHSLRDYIVKADYVFPYIYNAHI